MVVVLFVRQVSAVDAAGRGEGAEACGKVVEVACRASSLRAAPSAGISGGEEEAEGVCVG